MGSGVAEKSCRDGNSNGNLNEGTVQSEAHRRLRRPCEAWLLARRMSRLT